MDYKEAFGGPLIKLLPRFQWLSEVDLKLDCFCGVNNPLEFFISHPIFS